MKTLESSSFFDSVQFDCRSKNISLLDIEKLLEYNSIKSLNIKNWDRNFIYSNIDILYKIKNKTSVTFSATNYSNRDLSIIKDFSSNKIQANIIYSNVYKAKFAPWYISDSVEKVAWAVDDGNYNAINMRIKIAYSGIDVGTYEYMAFSKNQNGLLGSDVASLERMSSLDFSFLSGINSLMQKNYKKSLIYCMSVNDMNQINSINEKIINKIKSMGFMRLCIFDISNLLKKEISLKSYHQLSKIKKNINVIIYGEPVDSRTGYVSDYHRFDWMIPNNIVINNVESYNNSIYII